MRISIIEDNQDYLDNLEHVLSEVGHEVCPILVSHQNAETIAEVSNTFSPDVVLLDHHLSHRLEGGEVAPLLVGRLVGTGEGLTTQWYCSHSFRGKSSLQPGGFDNGEKLKCLLESIIQIA